MNGILLSTLCVLDPEEELRFLDPSGTDYLTTQRNTVEDLYFSGIISYSSDAECPRYGT